MVPNCGSWMERRVAWYRRQWPCGLPAWARLLHCTHWSPLLSSPLAPARKLLSAPPPRCTSFRSSLAREFGACVRLRVMTLWVCPGFTCVILVIDTKWVIAVLVGTKRIPISIFCADIETTVVIASLLQLWTAKCKDKTNLKTSASMCLNDLPHPECSQLFTASNNHAISELYLALSNTYNLSGIVSHIEAPRKAREYRLRHVFVACFEFIKWSEQQLIARGCRSHRPHLVPRGCRSASRLERRSTELQGGNTLLT